MSAKAKSKYADDGESADGIQMTNLGVRASSNVPQAQQIYSDPAVEKLAYARRLAGGQLVDYVLVYKLPAVNTKEFDELSSALAKPPSKNERDNVANARKRVFFENKLKSRDLILEPELAADGLTYYVKIHAPFSVLCRKAEYLKMKKQLKKTDTTLDKIMPSGLEGLSNMLGVPKLLKFAETGIPNDPDLYSANFESDRLNSFVGSENEETFFTEGQRAALVWHILCHTRYSTKRGDVGITGLTNKQIYAAAFPLHDGPATLGNSNTNESDTDTNVRATLRSKWGRLGMWYKFQPLDKVREYFGEQIGMYFGWLGFYTNALIIPAIIGLAVFFYGVGSNHDTQDAKELCETTLKMCPLCGTCKPWDLVTICAAYKASRIFDTSAMVAFGIIMSLWCAFFTDFWKRRNAELAYDWDVMEVDEDEPDRPQFIGTIKRKDIITGEEIKDFPAKVRFLRLLASFSFIVMMITLVIIIVVSVIVYRLAVNLALVSSSDDPNSSTAQNAGTITAVTAAVLNLIGIMLVGTIYNKMAVTLTDWENHRKESGYQSHLTFKMFLFSFVNSYTSIVYIAFFKGRFVGRPGQYSLLFGYRQDDCAPYGCMLELTIQMAVIMVGKQLIGNIQEVLLPKVFEWLRKRKIKTSKPLLPWVESMTVLAPYPPLGLFYEYLEMVIQFGFVTLFVSAFPLAPFFALINNIFEIRIDGEKLLTAYRRPPGVSSEGIGVWQGVLEMMSIIGVISNGAVIAFTSDFVTRAVYTYNHDGSLVGFVNATHPLAVGYSYYNNATGLFEPCYYSSLDENGEAGKFYYQVYVAKLAFMLVFEHVVFSLKSIIQYLVPDVPHYIDIALKREEYMAKRALKSDVLALEDSDDDDNKNEILDHTM